MPVLAPLAAYVGTFFTADAAAAGAGAAAGGAAAGGAAAGVAAGTAAAGTAVAGEAALDTVVVSGAAGAGVGAGTAATLGGAAAAGAATAAATGQPAPVASHSIAKTVNEASAIASGASALTTLANGPGKLNLPPAPGGSLPDQGALQAQAQAKQREAAAGGLQSTTGTSGGQAGAVLNPGTLSKSSLLGG